MRFKITIFLLSFSFISISAQAATYNFIFNNTEQGDNSTANPSVNTGGEKNQLPFSTPPSLPVTVSVNQDPDEIVQQKWKLFGGYTIIPQTKTKTDADALYAGESKFYGQQLTLGLEFSPMDRMAFRVEGFKKVDPVRLSPPGYYYVGKDKNGTQLGIPRKSVQTVYENVLDYSLGLTYQVARNHASRSKQISLGVAAGMVTVPTFNADFDSPEYATFEHQKHLYAGLQARANLSRGLGLELIYRNLVTGYYNHQVSFGASYVF